MKKPTIEEFIESEYAEEIQRAITGDSIIQETEKLIFKYSVTQPQEVSIGNSNIKVKPTQTVDAKILEYHKDLTDRMIQIKKDKINKLKCDSCVGAEYMKHILAHRPSST